MFCDGCACCLSVLTWSVGWAVVLTIIPADSNLTCSQTGNMVINILSNFEPTLPQYVSPKDRRDT